MPYEHASVGRRYDTYVISVGRRGRKSERRSRATAAHQAQCVFLEARATNSSNLESRSFRMGDSFDFL